MMEIIVTSGTGSGPTPLAAFDAALMNSGVANYNLIPLSSIIPHKAVVKAEVFKAPVLEYGHRLYVVMSRQDESERGENAVAGVGWTQAPDGHGLFVELHGNTNHKVQDDIETTLRAMMASRPNEGYGEILSKVVSVHCNLQPVCALVIAVYKSEGWK